MAADTTSTWPERDLEAVGACPVCGSTRRRSLYADLTDRVFGAPGRWALKQCESCLSVYLDPRPTPQAIARAYSTYYTHAAEGDRAAAPRLPFGSLAERWINGYRNQVLGTEIAGASRLGGTVLRLLPPAAAFIDCGTRHLNRPQAGANRLLDVGCGNGRFLELAARLGWSATGIDMDEKAVAAAKSRALDVSTASLGDLAAGGPVFDVVTLSHIIEHVHDPLAMLRQCFGVLKPGGKLWLETPNIQSLGHRRFGRNWRGLEPPRHLVIFTPDSVSYLLGQAGFIAIQQKNRGLNNTFTYAESRLIERNERAGGKPLRVRIDSLLVRDAVVQYFRPQLRDLITMTCCKPLGSPPKP